MNTIENLNGKDILITEARRVEGGKVQLAFAQKVENPEARPSSIVGLLNASDERFTQSGKPRYAWIAGTSQDIQKMLGIDVSDLTEVGQTKELNVLNPTINGQALNIQITETTEGSEYDLANIETRAKRAGKDGDYIKTEDGRFIFVKATVVTGEPKHVFIKNTMREPLNGTSLESAIGSALES
jgi:hypothetical protein